jgi:hypothetical protein
MRFSTQLILLATLGSFACGPQARPAATHSEFRSYQELENTNSVAQVVASNPAETCPTRCDASAESRTASEDLCQRTETSPHSDERAWCEQSRRRATAAEQSSAAACSCAGARP